MSDLISRQDAIDAITNYIHNVDKVMGAGSLSDDDCKDAAQSVLEDISSANIEPLTDNEQRIFLKALSREEEVCKKVDAEWGEGDEECEINLVHVCHEITRKVKGALWT